MPYPSEGLESAYKTNHIDDVKVRTYIYYYYAYGRCNRVFTQAIQSSLKTWDENFTGPNNFYNSD